MDSLLKKILASVLIILVAAGSFTFVADKAADPETHTGTIASVDDKVSTVMELTAAATIASAGISAVPDDTATPIAEKLADFAEYFLLVLCVLYAEKYLLTVVAIGTFKILIPIACVLCIVTIFHDSPVLRKLALKLAVFGLALYLVTPASIKVSDMIYESYRGSIDNTIAAAEQLSNETEESDLGTQTLWERLSNTVTGLADRAAKLLSNFIEVLAVMIVTSCIIPLLVLIFFIWMVKILTGVDIPIRMPGRRRGRHAAETATELLQ